MMLVERSDGHLRRVVTGRMVGCGDSPNPKPSVGSVFEASAFPPVSCRLRTTATVTPTVRAPTGLPRRSSIGERF